MACCGSNFKRWLRLLVTFVASFAAVYLGVLGLGWDLLGLGILIQNAPVFAYPLLYAIGIFGVISLILIILGLLQDKE